MTRRTILSLTLPLAAGLLAACSGMPGTSGMSRSMAFDQSALSEAVRVPTGNRVAMETMGVGEITYECRDRASGGGQ